jgi:hypothetical protein
MVIPRLCRARTARVEIRQSQFKRIKKILRVRTEYCREYCRWLHSLLSLVKRMRSQYGLWLGMSHNRGDWLSTAYPSWLLNVDMPKHVPLYVLCSVYSRYSVPCTTMYPPSIGILLSPNVVIPSNQHIAPDQCWAQDRSPRAWKTDTRNLQAPKGPSTSVYVQTPDTRGYVVRSMYRWGTNEKERRGLINAECITT